jgi:hypothetical protein
MTWKMFGVVLTPVVCHFVLLLRCCMLLLHVASHKTGLLVLPLDAVSLRWPTWTACHLFPSYLLVSNLGGMGGRQLWGPFARFALVTGDHGDLSKTTTSREPGFARLTSAKSATNICAHASTAHFEVRSLDHLGTRMAAFREDESSEARGG